MTVKIELTLPALERLLAGDSEMEVALRYQIVEAFAEKHLKALLNDEAHKKTRELWREEIKTAVDAKVNDLKVLLQGEIEYEDFPNSTRFWALNDVIDKLVNARVDARVAGIIEDRTNYYRQFATRVITESLQKEIPKRIQDGVTELLEKAKNLAKAGGDS